jgi:hypothetical protein
MPAATKHHHEANWPLKIEKHALEMHFLEIF